VPDLNDTSTLADVFASYQANASYVEENSIPKARKFITACTIYLGRLASATGKGSNTVSYGANLNAVRGELNEAKAWLRARSEDDRPGPDVTYADLTDLRRI
jgi:hypothetical protein